MQKSFLVFAMTAVMLPVFVSSCNKEEVAVVETNTVAETGKLLSATLISSVPAADAVENALNTASTKSAELSSYGNFCDSDFQMKDVEALRGLGLMFETYRIKYTSVGGSSGIFGNLSPIELTGDVSFLRDMSGRVFRVLESVSLFSMPFCPDDFSATLIEDVVIPIRAAYNALVVVPHFQGTFENRGVNTQLISDSFVKAHQAIDCELAALKLVEKLFDVRMALGYYTDNMGLGTGAGTALATQYLLEHSHIEDNKYIHLCSTYCGEGCYSYREVFENLFKESEPVCCAQKDNRADTYIGLVIGSYDLWEVAHYNPARDYKVELESYFSEEFLEKEACIFGEEMSYIDIYRAGLWSLVTEELALEDVINPGILKEDGTLNTKDLRIKALFVAFSEDDDYLPEGWTPKSHLSIVHSCSDAFYPFSSAMTLYDNLSNGGKNFNVKFKAVPMFDRNTAIVCEFLFDLALKKHPCAII